MKAALPDWTVIYFDEAKLRRNLKARWDKEGRYEGEAPRRQYEYEIVLPEEPPAP